jgi:hypothetical protein
MSTFSNNKLALLVVVLGACPRTWSFLFHIMGIKGSSAIYRDSSLSLLFRSVSSLVLLGFHFYCKLKWQSTHRVLSSVWYHIRFGYVRYHYHASVVPEIKKKIVNGKYNSNHCLKVWHDAQSTDFAVRTEFQLQLHPLLDHVSDGGSSVSSLTFSFLICRVKGTGSFLTRLSDCHKLKMIKC